MRPADRRRVTEIAAEVGGGVDYLPEQFDSWVSDPGASFEAAELDGTVVAVHRLRPIATGVVFYEGLRVASTHRRRGIGRALVRRAVEEARDLGFAEVRLIAQEEESRALFSSEGFRLLADCATWTGRRMEGGDPPRLASTAESAELAERARQHAALAAYGGVCADVVDGPLDVDGRLLERLAEQGRVRVGPGGRALALLRAGFRRRLPVTFLSGSGAALQDLLMALRFEADSLGVAAVAVLAPAGHPAAGDLVEVGYHLADDEHHTCVFGLELPVRGGRR